MSAAADFLSKYWMAVASHLWQTTIVILVLAGLACIMRRAPARVLNALWWVALAKLVVPFAFIAPAVRRAIEPVAASAGAAGIRLDAVTFALDRAAPILDPVASVADSDSSTLGMAAVVLFAAWLLGAAWFAVSWLRGRDGEIVARARRPEALPVELRTRLATALGGTGVRAGAVLVTDEPLTPAVVGVLRRRILLSTEVVSRLGESELRAILLHENAHRRRFEPLQVAVQRAAIVAFYFFPLLWPLLWKLRETSEMACDEAALEKGVGASEYARAMARTMGIGLESLGVAAGFARGTPTLTRRRFERLEDEGRFTLMRWHWLCIGLAVLAAMATAVTSAVPRALADERDETTRSITTEISVDEDAGKTIDVTIEADVPADAEEDEAETTTFTLRLTHSEDPEYPEDAKKNGAGGRVLLKLSIDGENGTVAEIIPLEVEEDYPSFTESAIEAAGLWTFEVVGDADPPEHVDVIVPIEFKIDGDKTMTLSLTIPDVEVAPEEPKAPEEPEVPEVPEAPEEPEAPEAPEEPKAPE